MPPELTSSQIIGQAKNYSNHVRLQLTSHAFFISASKSSHLEGMQGVRIANSNPRSLQDDN